MKISATIITCNEERNLPRAIESLRCCDEILVVDSGSTDRTVEIAGKFGAHMNDIPELIAAAVDCNLVLTTRGEWVEVQATGVIHGDVKGPRLIVHEGAVINGSIEMSKASAPAKVAATSCSNWSAVSCLSPVSDAALHCRLSTGLWPFARRYSADTRKVSAGSIRHGSVAPVRLGS